MGEPTLLLKAISLFYRRSGVQRGAGRLIDALPLRLLGGEEIWTDAVGARLLVRTRDQGARDILLRGELSHEQDEIRIVRALLCDSRGFMDVGASFGWYTGLASAMMPATGRTVAVEANPEVFRCLIRSCAQLPRTTAIFAAATASEGPVTFHCAPGSNLSSAVRPVGQAVTVPGCRLDDMWPIDDPLDLVKCDIEGGELEALIGARELRKTWEPVWMLEFDQAMLKEAGNDPRRVADELGAIGWVYRSECGWEESLSVDDVMRQPRSVKNVFLVPESRTSWFRSALARSSD